MTKFYWPALLLLATIVLLAFELVIPSGGVIGIIAVMTYLASLIAAYASLGFQLGTLYLISTMIVATVTGTLFVRIWPKTALGRRIFGSPPSEEEVIPQRQREMDSLIGSRGTAISAMLPSGGIRVQGRIMDAVSAGMPIEANTPVEIIEVKGNHLVVRPLDSSVAPQTESDVQDALKQPIDSFQDPFQD